VEEPGVAPGRLKWAGDVMRIEGKELQKRTLMRFDGGRREITQKLIKI
jgi:hypothetical protein